MFQSDIIHILNIEHDSKQDLFSKTGVREILTGCLVPGRVEMGFSLLGILCGDVVMLPPPGGRRRGS